MKVSDIVIKFLEQKGIDTAFTVSGGGCIHLIDSLRKSNIDVLCPHHEQSALMASEGYYRQSNRMSANIVTTGPGGPHAITGLLGLWLDSIPTIVVSGQVSQNQLSEGTGCRQIGDQEFDIIGVVKSMTKYCVMIKDPLQILAELEKAYQIAIEGRPGPVWIDIPLDIQGANVNIEECYTYSHIFSKNIIDETKIDDIVSLLETSKKPLLIVGNGIRLSECYDRLNSFISANNIPVVTGPHSGVDAVDNTLPSYCGRIGILGQLTSNQIVQEADLLIALGTRLPIKMTGYNISEFSPNSKKVIVDIDLNEINKHKFNVDISIVGDLRDFFTSLEKKKVSVNIKEWVSHVREIRTHQKYFYPKHENLQGYASFYYLINKAPSIFGNTPIVTSNGTAHVVTLQTYCLANNKNPVICIEGDGSLMMNLQELQTIVGYNLPVKILLVNNDGYLSIKMTQEAFFNGAEFASSKTTGVTIPDYKKIASAFGIPYLSINSNKEIENVLNEMMNINGPCFVEAFTHPKERHEPKVTHKGIDKDGKIIPGTLTDMFISDIF